MSIESYLKKHSEALVKDVGIEAACSLTGLQAGRPRVRVKAAPAPLAAFGPSTAVAASPGAIRA